MSHVVSIATKVKDPAAVAAACQRLNLPAPTPGTARLYSGEVTGLLVQLPGWQYPAVIDTATGTIRYDDFEGAWGDRRHLDAFLQAYAIEVVRIESRKKGYLLTEQPLADGSVKLLIQEGA